MRSRSSILEEGFAEREVSFGQCKVEQPKKPRFLTYRGSGVRYGTWHAFDKVSIAPPIEEAMEGVAPVVLPTNGVDRVYGRRGPGRIAVAESAVVAVNRKTQSLLHNLAIGRPYLDQLGDDGSGELSHRGKAPFVETPPSRLGSPTGLPFSAVPLPEPADLSIVLLPDAFLLETLPAVRLASLFGLAIRASFQRAKKERGLGQAPYPPHR